jgi:hypothetical protein
LQPAPTAGLGVVKSILGSQIQGIAVGELCGPEGSELLWCGDEFKFGGESCAAYRTVLVVLLRNGKGKSCFHLHLQVWSIQVFIIE